MARGTVEREESDLAREAEFVLPLRCGQERAVAATKSYLASLTVPLPLIAALRGDAGLTRALETLPEALEGTLGLEGQAGTWRNGTASWRACWCWRAACTTEWGSRASTSTGPRPGRGITCG